MMARNEVTICLVRCGFERLAGTTQSETGAPILLHGSISEAGNISGRLDQPAVFVAGRIELRERREAAADGGQRQRLLRLGNRLWHDAPGAVRELVNAPKLIGPAGERR